MDRFLRCLCDKEFDALVIDDSPVSEDVLLLTWSNIYIEFNDLMGDDTHSQLTDAVKKVNKISSTITLATAILSYLMKEHRPDLADMLTKIGLKVTLDPDNEAAYYNNLKLIQIRIKKLMNDLEEAHAEVLKLQGDHVEQIDAYNFFDDWFIGIGAYQKYEVNPADITVSRFCKLVNRIKQAKLRKELQDGN